MATLEERINDGVQAQAVLDNPAFAAAFATIRQEYVDAWISSPARDPEGREKLYWMLKTTDKLEATLRGVLETGKLASLELEHQRELLERERAAGVETSGWAIPT